MQANFTFYVHHHGSGHITRALAIASHLKDARITFMGSGLNRYKNLIPAEISCIHLPDDVAGPDDPFASLASVSFLHYAPLNVKRVAERVAMISETLRAVYPSVLIVDVSVEVTLLAALAGIPTIVIRQNGDRQDLPHLQAYECAQLLLAPSPEKLIDTSPFDWVERKTVFSGGFSRFTGAVKHADKDNPDSIAILVGAGGTSIDADLAATVAMQCPDKTIHVIGQIGGRTQSVKNLVSYGQISDPAAILAKCSVVIGNAGHNTVMEMADLNKKFICLPEQRPFNEQFSKADLLEKHGMAVVIDPAKRPTIDWNKVISRAEALPENRWQGVINRNALGNIAHLLHQQWQKNFQL